MSASVVFEVPQEVLDSARLTPNQLKTELAVSLYAQGRLSLGKARELTDLSLWEFRQLLAARRIPVHYDLNDLQDDLATLKELDQP